MKKILIAIFLITFVPGASAQEGIQFSTDTWEKVLHMAKKENKLVFIDVATSWCGPCKKMAAEVFPQEEVGNLFNASFVNYKIDAEKGEGIAIARKFEVKAFPTYLFVNGDGRLIYRTTGYMPANAFMHEAQIALQEQEDPKPFVEWEAEYNSGKRDKEFLLGYLKKRALLKLPSAEIAEEVFPMLTEAELADKEVLSSILYFDPAIQFVPEGRVDTYVMKNYKMLDSLKRVAYPLSILNSGIYNYFLKNIIPNRREEMLPVTIRAMKKIMVAMERAPDKIVVGLMKLPVTYYEGTHNEEKLNPAVTDYVENGIMKLDIRGMQAADAANFAKFMEPYLSGKKDSTGDRAFSMKRLMKSREMLPVSYNLRDAAEAVYHTSQNKKMLKKATGWARQANEWFPHFSSQAVYAGLLFKTGNREKAIEVMQKARKDSFLSQAKGTKSLLLENVEMMEKGKAPEHLWNL